MKKFIAFHEFQSEKVLDEIQLSPQLEQKYDQDIFRLLNIRGKVTINQMKIHRI